jgi:hypothetical protein
MGVLDDAIREHLELKRKHGVPEEELQRQEEEALGPARRDVARQREEAEPTDGQAATATADESPAPAADQETALFDMEADAAPSAEAPAVEEAEPTPVEPPPVEAPPGPPAAESAPAPSRPVELHEPGRSVVGEPGHEPDPRDALGDTEPHGFAAVEDEEGLEEDERGEPELDDEELLSAEEEAAAEEGDPDVLEDTPDFLQETPEHDRLWFEQKPPRDFDFD